jgi:hypothetical protein
MELKTPQDFKRYYIGMMIELGDKLGKNDEVNAFYAPSPLD